MYKKHFLRNQQHFDRFVLKCSVKCLMKVVNNFVALKYLGFGKDSSDYFVAGVLESISRCCQSTLGYCPKINIGKLDGRV